MKTQKNHSIDLIFILLLFFIFAISSLAVVYIGSQVYSSTVDTMDKAFHQNIVLDYISEKVRQNNSLDQIEIKNIQDTDILCLHEIYDGESYTTYIYTYNQELKELFIHDDEDFQIENGETLTKADDLSFSIDHSLLKVDMTLNHQTRTIYLSLVGGM
jgi:hypothetical protein